MRVLGLIPARAGSKRLPRKNLLPLAGEPLIGHTIRAGQASSLITDLIVSTDCEEIAKVAREYGVDVPFLRPAEISGDESSDRDVLLHALNFYQRHGIIFDVVSYLRPTTPLKTPTLVDMAISKLKSDDSLTGVRSVTKVSGIFHPYWSYRPEGGELRPFVEGTRPEEYYQSQKLPECLRLNGVSDALRPKVIAASKNIFGDSLGFVETNEIRSVDIDTNLDFLFCEAILGNQLI